MSFSQATDKPTATQSFDDWLAKVGVSVPKMRDDRMLAAAAAKSPADDYRAEKALAEPVMKPVDDEMAANTRPLAAAAMRKWAYSDTAKRLDAAEAAQDYPTALKRLREKKAKAALIQPALDYLGNPNLADFEDSFRKAEHCLKVSSTSKLLEKARTPYDTARAKQLGAEQAFDFTAAAAARVEASAAATTLSAFYASAVKADRFAPLVKRAEDVLAADKAGRIPDDRRNDIQSFAAEFHKYRSTQDYSDWDGKSMDFIEKAARNFIADFSGQSADDFWDAGMKSPSGMKKTFGRLRGKQQSQGSQQPALAGLSEAKKMDAIGDVAGMNPAALKGKVVASFRIIKTSGLEWDISPVELAALYAYTTQTYKKMNQLLRDQADGKPSSVPPGTDILVAAARDAMAKLPPYDPTGFPLFRCEKVYGNNLVDRYTPGTVFTVPDFWSTGAAKGADPSADSDAEIVVWGKKTSAAKTIGPISASTGEGKKGAPLKGQGEGEVLFPPGAKFKTVIFKDHLAGGELAKARGFRGLRYQIQVMEV